MTTTAQKARMDTGRPEGRIGLRPRGELNPIGEQGRAMPNTKSAAATTHVINRRLRLAGFLMAATPSPGKWTEGLYVRCTGYNMVHVGYHYNALPGSPAVEEEARRDEAMEKAERLLVELGYPVEKPNGWTAGLYVRCSNP
jgi:hypothetical protein